MTKNQFTIQPGNALPLGVTKVADGVQFAIYLPDKRECYLKLFRKGHQTEQYRMPLTDEYRMGSVYFVHLRSKNTTSAFDIAEELSDKYEYVYEADGEDIVDPYAAGISGRDRWNRTDKMPVRGRICLKEFDWEGDYILRKPFHELVLYQLHVRGFTKHASSGVSKPGTFAGLQDKIPYMKDLGINGVLLLPVYDFEEKQGDKVNYWGYGVSDTYYFAPKAAYSSGENADEEFKETIKKLHRNGMEVILDFYFAPGTNLNLMTDCLRHWVLNYHVDGFRVNTEVMPSLTLASDPILSGVKLFSSYWDEEMLSGAGIHQADNCLAEYNEGFMNDARRFLKSDEGQAEAFYKRFYRHPDKVGVINFMTHVNGFTMMDLVSYDIKHNESNGERNADGTEYNYSWNCGVEGPSRRLQIRQMRERQIRNAFLMVLLSQGVPMIYGGDEFGNSQNGNNNAYCQDNQVGWIDWKALKKNESLFQFVKNAIAFRKEHPILHVPGEMYGVDYQTRGLPDVSLHGERAWYMNSENTSRLLGIMYCGAYAHRADGSEDASIYVAYNFHWEDRIFALPNLAGYRKWKKVIDTSAVKENGFLEQEQETYSKKLKVTPRTIVVLMAVEEEKKDASVAAL